MKKLLLSALCFAGAVSMATAADTTLDVNNATDFEGTLVEERPAGTNGDTDNGQAKHYQPIEALTIDGYKFSFTKGGANSDPAYYWSMSTSTKQQQTIRIYSGKDATAGNTMTITAPEGVTFGTIEFTGTNGKANGVVDASVGTANMTSASVVTWTNTEAVNTVTLTFKQNYRITKMVVKGEGGAVTPDPDPEPTGVKFSKVTELVSGTYVFVVNEDGTLKLARPYIGTQSYGRMNLTGATLDGNDVVTTEDNSFEITVADGKATIKNGDKYYAMDAPENNHFTSFQFYTELNEGCYWTYEFVDGAVKMTNALSTECFISQTKGTQGTWFTNVAPAKAPAEYNLPMLYKKASGAGVEAIEAEADANAPVVYYNLQGQRIAHPANGLYIRVQGNKVEKVVVR